MRGLGRVEGIPPVTHYAKEWVQLPLEQRVPVFLADVIGRWYYEGQWNDRPKWDCLPVPQEANP